jgi:hypothetical protein
MTLPSDPFSIAIDLVGLTGVILILSAYLLLQSGKWHSGQLRFPLTNLIGSCLIFTSLIFNWNLPSVVIETCWILISLYGTIRILLKK